MNFCHLYYGFFSLSPFPSHVYFSVAHSVLFSTLLSSSTLRRVLMSLNRVFHHHMRHRVSATKNSNSNFRRIINNAPIAFVSSSFETVARCPSISSSRVVSRHQQFIRSSQNIVVIASCEVCALLFDFYISPHYGPAENRLRLFSISTIYIGALLLFSHFFIFILTAPSRVH